MPNQISIPIERGAKTWIDVTDPTPKELEDLALQHGLHPAFVQDCLDPSHLPKFEQHGDVTFIIARAFDERSGDNAETIQELTRKIALFISPRTVLTIHRLDQPFLAKLREQWTGPSGLKRTQAHLVNSLMAKVISSYGLLIARASDRLDAMEENVFRRAKDGQLLKKSYELKRATSIAERLVRMTEEIIPVPADADRDAPYIKDLEDQLKRALFSFDDLERRIEQLLQLHLAIESQKNNDVMRVLTLFSAFFLPLTFIAGIYGMNFAHIPELAWELGYPFALALMLGVSLCIWFWFRKKKWI